MKHNMLKTPVKSKIEFKIYFNKKVSFRRDKYSDVDSKNPKKTVTIGKATNKEIKKELIYQKLNLLCTIF